MSTLSVTSINTANATTDLTVRTGNSTAAGIVLQSNGNALVLQSNSTTNAVFLASNGNIGIGNTTPANKLTISGNPNILGTSATTTGLVVTQTDTGAAVNFGFDNAANSAQAVAGTGTSFRISSNGIQRIVFSADGTTTHAGNNLNLGTSSIAANGYTRLPNGLLLQYGSQTAAVNASTGATITFPVAFTAVYSVSIIPIGSGSTSNIAYINAAPTTTGMTWRNALLTTAANQTVYYMAIGT